MAQFIKAKGSMAGLPWSAGASLSLATMKQITKRSNTKTTDRYFPCRADAVQLGFCLLRSALR
jgi:hypothetical protein